jgi:hypothetical protein
MDFKRLRDWTIGEVAQVCESQKGNCPCQSCIFYTDSGCVMQSSPIAWYLDYATSNFSEQEIEDAKTLMRLFPEISSVQRTRAGSLDLIYRNKGTETWITLGSTMFPSIKCGEEIKISEIARYKND